ncbi:asparagine synthetase B family protein [Streptomyces sp. CA-179760]|uniref:asparagine synthetase B family protein n=1 Tax=Streptomyces sp. CA-179760 TaxID=3240054 RepID=UPI003D8C1D2C
MSLAPAPSRRWRADRLARQAIGKLPHRGPDGHGVVGDDGSAVAMCRLRVRSRPGDAVPFAGPSAAYAFNGEVYVAGGTVPAGGLDEAEAVHAAGDPSGTALDGMYALVRRAPDGSLTVGRDLLGIKPLYLRRHPAGVAVASEIPALLDLFGPAEVRRAAVAQFLLYGRVVDGGTFYEDITPVPPGARLLIKEGHVQHLGTDTVAPAPQPAGPGELRAAVAESVRRLLVSDRPLGLALSGGLDSTVLALELARLGVRDLSTVSVVPDGNGDGVTDLSALGLPGTVWHGWRHRWARFGPDDLLDGIPDAVRALGEPTAMTSVPMYAELARLAQESGIVVLLAGEGADELFGGYRSYLRLPDTTDPASFYLPTARADLLRSLLDPDAHEAAHGALHDALPTSGDRQVTEIVREFEYTHSLEPLLRRADHLLMARGVEGRTPFLHGGLPALAAALPFAGLVGGGQTKLPLRQAYAADLPAYRDEIKKPFRAPVADWLTGPAAERAVAGLQGHRDRLTGPGLRPEGVDHLVAGLRAGDPTAAELAFPLLTLGAWLELRADQSASPRN